MSDVIEICSQGILKTLIIYKVNLTYVQLAPYLKELQENGFIETVTIEGKNIYRATARGRDFLDVYEKIRQMLDGSTRQPTYERYSADKIPIRRPSLREDLTRSV